MKKPIGILLLAAVLAVMVGGKALAQEGEGGVEEALGGAATPEYLGRMFCQALNSGGIVAIMSLLPGDLRQAMDNDGVLGLVAAELEQEFHNNPVAGCNPGPAELRPCGELPIVGQYASRTGSMPKACAAFQAWTATNDGEERDFRAAMVRSPVDGQWYILPMNPDPEDSFQVWQPPAVADPHADMASLANSVCLSGVQGDVEGMFQLMHPAVKDRAMELMGGQKAWDALMVDARISIREDPVVNCELVSTEEVDCGPSMSEVLKSAVGVEFQSCGVIVLTARQSMTGERFEHIPVFKVDNRWYLGGE